MVYQMALGEKLLAATLWDLIELRVRQQSPLYFSLFVSTFAFPATSRMRQVRFILKLDFCNPIIKSSNNQILACEELAPVRDNETYSTTNDGLAVKYLSKTSTSLMRQHN